MSLRSKIFNTMLKFSSYKKNFLSERNIKKYIQNVSKKKYNLPKKIKLNLEEFDDFNVYSYNGTIKDNNNKILLYLHGGSFIEEAVYYQLEFAMKVAKKTGSTLIFPQYLLAPKYNYKHMYRSIYKLYNKLTDVCKEINFFGDSAGAGFILSFSMYLRDNKLQQPKNIIMLSPWLDISLTNPELKKYEKKDAMSGIVGNQYSGQLWKDDLEYNNYLVSPMYGNVMNLGKLTVIVGTNDLLKPDVDKFINKLDALNIEYNYFEYKNQFHDFGMFPIPEGHMVNDEICKIINKEDNNGQQ